MTEHFSSLMCEEKRLTNQMIAKREQKDRVLRDKMKTYQRFDYERIKQTKGGETNDTIYWRDIVIEINW